MSTKTVKEIPPIKVYFPQEDIDEIKEHVEKIIKSGMLTLYTYNFEFEKKFAELCKVKHAVAVSSGTGALEIILRALDIKNGDEVIVPTNTFTATATSVILTGGKVVLADIDPASLCIDAENILKKVTKKTRAVIAVHIGGLICPDIFEIKKVCKENDLFLIEDAAHAHGSTMDGKVAGALGDAAGFSFYPTKVMTTCEGGIITTDSDKVAEVATILRDQGKASFSSSDIVKFGYSWRLDEISAAIGLVQLRRLDEIIKKRNAVAKYYDDELSKIAGIKPLEVPKNSVCNFYKYTTFLERGINRDQVKQELRKRGVRCGGEVYWPPLHLQPVYREVFGTKEGDFPATEDVCKRMLCLPMYTQMTMDEAGYVVDKIKEVLAQV